MNLGLKVAFVIYLVHVLVLFSIGLMFEFSREFLPFHSDVIQTKWGDVDALSQILYLGMMRTEAAGFLATGAAFAILLCIPFLRFEKWACWAMSIIGIVEYSPSLVANYHVASVTSASPPWIFMLALILSLVIALWAALIGLQRKNLESRLEGDECR